MWLELRRREGGGKVNGLCLALPPGRIFAAKCTKLQLNCVIASFAWPTHCHFFVHEMQQ
jgi:hypothetical protein